ncbi:MAG: hypothetical protein LDL55_10765 [Armatimonadetes bacterium]|nr:hypothetical protein [Armatimonadota bacterium]
MARSLRLRFALFLAALLLLTAGGRSPVLATDRVECDCCRAQRGLAVCCAKLPGDCGACVARAPLTFRQELRAADAAPQILLPEPLRLPAPIPQASAPATPRWDEPAPRILDDPPWSPRAPPVGFEA